MEGDCDVQCEKCGSVKTDEPHSVLSELVANLDTAEAEVARLKGTPSVYVVKDKAGLIVGAYNTEDTCKAVVEHRAGWTYKPYVEVKL